MEFPASSASHFFLFVSHSAHFFLSLFHLRIFFATSNFPMYYTSLGERERGGQELYKTEAEANVHMHTYNSQTFKYTHRQASEHVQPAERDSI